METLTETKIDSIFGPSRNGNIGWGYHNVGSVFPASTPELYEKIAAHYGQRCTHFPDTHQLGVIVETRNPIINSQMEYLSQILGKKITIRTFEDLGQQPGSLVVPYINISSTEQRLKASGFEVWGLPSRMVDVLKNKADCHNIITQLGIPNFETPPFELVAVDKLPTQAMSHLKSIEESYAKVGLSGNYPIGIMLRGAESGGNYGACILVEEKGQPVVIADGDAKTKKSFKCWDQALTQAQTYLQSTASANIQVEPRVVMSRYMQLESSPGISAFIIDGKAIAIGWNDQVQDIGSSACIGTSTYQPKNEVQTRWQSEFEEQTSEAFCNFLLATANKLGVNSNTIRGVANVDLMIPGALECEYQRRLGHTPRITVAEINPRFTAWTGALLTVIAAEGKEKTITEILNTRDHGVLEAVKYPLNINGTSLNIVRDRIQELDDRLKPSGTRIIVNICDNPMGLIFSGDIPRAQHELSQTLSAFK